jgi:co-chaperonin GroES (HSP10)
MFKLMFNNNLTCEDVSSKPSGGFQVEDSAVKFKTLRVIKSNEEDVKEDDLLSVPVNCGEKISLDNKDYLVIKRTDIIGIL